MRLLQIAAASVMGGILVSFAVWLWLVATLLTVQWVWDTIIRVV